VTPIKSKDVKIQTPFYILLALHPMTIKAEAIKTWKLSAPIIFGELTQMALGIIDSVMVGKISYQHLAAAALVNSVLNIPFVLGFGMTMSVSQTVSMANGRKDSLKVSIIYTMVFGYVASPPSSSLWF
jgi:Na+-driven multidrug efflux pump